MSQVLAELLYTKEHEWVKKLGGNLVRIGITDFAQSQLGDIVFVELPEAGSTLSAHESIGTVESVKTVSDIFTPVSGKVVQINGSLEDAPETVNSDPYEQGWMLEVEVSGDDAFEGLLTAEEYAAYTEGDH
ncbi:glycine cleavage system protein GcvH [Paenibacillus sp. MBLB4367]|uniref:glycine cleavage system protein GcvH n=1 Tax=Paenibacillus sp. MBLB4367 TaxID=3384767 RepID=UPI0039083C66